MLRELGWDLGQPGSIPHSTMEACQVTLGSSQSLSLTHPHKVIIVKIKGEGEEGVKGCFES